MIEGEIDKSAWLDIILYELDWRKKAHKAEIEEKNKEIKTRNEELKTINEENAKLKALLIENDIDF